MRDAAGRGMTPTKHNRSPERFERIMCEAEAWLRESVQCEQLIDWTGWPWNPEKCVEVAKNGDLNWSAISLRLSRMLTE